MTDRFRFDFDRRFTGLLRLLGIRPSKAHVTIHDDQLEVRFGPWVVTSPLDNIAHAEVTGPHRKLKAIGPRFSPSTRSLTFGSNARRTVRIEFHRPVSGIEPLGVLRHPSLSVSVARPSQLQRALERAAASAD